MSGKPIFIQLNWEDPAVGPRAATLQAPIGIGRESSQMPEQVGGRSPSCLELNHKQVSRYHALITVANQRLYITDKSANGTFLNGRPVQRDGQAFTAKDTLRIGPFKITASVQRDGASNATELNPDRSHVVATRTTGPSKITIALAGAAILLLMGLGTWAIARGLLDQLRPTPEAEPLSTLRQVGVETAFR